MIIPPTNPVKTVAITAISLMRVGSISKYSATPPQTPPIIYLNSKDTIFS